MYKVHLFNLKNTHIYLCKVSIYILSMGIGSLKSPESRPINLVLPTQTGRSNSAIKIRYLIYVTLNEYIRLKLKA